MATLLVQIREKVAVDVDSMDPKVAERHTAAGDMFHDMTSNQAIVQVQAANPDSAGILKEVCDRVKSSKLDLEHQVSDALDLLVRVTAVSSPSHPTLTATASAVSGRALCQGSSAVPQWTCTSADGSIGCL